MPKDYHHLAYEQRCQLYVLKKRGDSLAEISRQLGVDKSTISRELWRNTGKRGYRFKQAQENSLERSHKSNSHPRKMIDEVLSLIDAKLREQWSPEQISGWLKKKSPEHAVSHETIYRYVWEDKRNGGSLYKFLRHRGKKYNKRGAGKAGRGCIPNRRDITERPSVVEEKSRLGDWELDTIVGAGHAGAIVSIVERTSKLTKLVKVERATADRVEQAIVSALSPIQEFVLTLTADNGKEFASHQEVARKLNTDFFFARPYHSWERGLNEHTNGLVRQYFPKATSFLEVSQDELDRVEFLLNNRPRKVLEYSTPIEVFEKLSNRSSSVALRT